MTVTYMSYFVFLWTARQYPELYPFKVDPVSRLLSESEDPQLLLDQLILMSDLSLMGAFPPRYLESVIERIEDQRLLFIESLQSDLPILQSVFRDTSHLPVRLDFLKSLLSSADPLTFSKVWPNLKVVLLWRDAVCKAQMKSLEPRIGNTTAIYNQSYASSEACFSFQLNPSDKGQTIIPQANLLEFLDLDSGDIFKPWEIKEGCQYELLVTNSMGLVRYRMKDVVECMGFTNQLPQIVFVRKAEEVLLLGIRISEGELQKTFLKYFSKVPFHWRVAVNDLGNGLVFLSNSEENICLEDLDKTLQENHAEYKDCRAKGVLKPLTHSVHSQKILFHAQSKPRLILSSQSF